MVCRVKDLSLSVRKKEILHNINLDIEEGKVYGLVGNNGAGKTTLLKVMAGLVRVHEGAVVFEKSDTKVGYDIGGYTEIEGISGKNLLTYYAKLCGCYTPEYIDELLENIGLTEHANKRLEKYSTGMKQRLFFAIAVLNNPDLLILDEPTSGTDYAANIRVKEMISQIMSEHKTSVIISNHDMEDLYEVSDFFLFIQNGEIVSQISKKELLERESIAVDAEYAQVKDIFTQFIIEGDTKI